MHTLIKDIIRIVAEKFPLSAAGYTKDAIGLQIGFSEEERLTKALIVYEVTDDVVSEAESIGANLIISYHPLIFPHVAAITDSTRTGALIRRLIQSRVALYVIHTAFDTNSDMGTSRQMANALELNNIKPLTGLTDALVKIVIYGQREFRQQIQQAMWNAGAGTISNYDECSFVVEGSGTFKGNERSNPAVGLPNIRETVDEVAVHVIAERWKISCIIAAAKAAINYEEIAYDIYPIMNQHPKLGMGSIGEFEEMMTTDEVLTKVKQAFGTSTLRHSSVDKKFRKAAMVGGSGMEYYSAAKAIGADVFITGDIHYHDFYRAEHDGVLLIDAGHSETEQFITKALAESLRSAVPSSLIYESTLKPNAVRYY